MQKVRVKNKKQLLSAVESVSLTEKTMIFCGGCTFIFDPLSSLELARVTQVINLKDWQAKYNKKLRSTLGRIRRLPATIFKEN